MNAPPMAGDHLDASPSETVRRHAATFRRVRLARHAALSDEVVPRPQPHTPAREALPDEVPASAKRLAKLAEDRGWDTRVVYARSSSGVDTVSVRCWLGELLVVGVWRDGRWSDGIARLSDGMPRKVGSATGVVIRVGGPALR